MTRCVRGFHALVLGVCALGAITAPRTARACGGFFCSNASRPVAQSGEEILFSIDADGSITAVVQIAYAGPAESFAWIVPVPSVPELSTGTNALFDCKVSCQPPTPDDEGYCDCDVQYDTCAPV